MTVGPGIMTSCLRHWWHRKAMVMAVGAAAIGLSACATLPSDPDERAEVERLNDPFEPLNREVYAFNSDVNHSLADVGKELKPIAPVWLGVRNVLTNLREPMVFVNDVAQAHECGAETAFRRFLINSTIGIAGLFDIAATYGLESHENDVGQTLAVWGVPAGPYLVLPAIGPTDVRGAVGTGVEFVADPVDIAFVQAGAAAAVWPRAGLDTLDRNLDASGDLAKLERSSLDGYSALRSAYRQNLEAAMTDAPCAPLR